MNPNHRRRKKFGLNVFAYLNLALHPWDWGEWFFFFFFLLSKLYLTRCETASVILTHCCCNEKMFSMWNDQVSWQNWHQRTSLGVLTDSQFSLFFSQCILIGASDPAGCSWGTLPDCSAWEGSQGSLLRWRSEISCSTCSNQNQIKSLSCHYMTVHATKLGALLHLVLDNIKTG